MLARRVYFGNDHRTLKFGAEEFVTNTTSDVVFFCQKIKGQGHKDKIHQNVVNLNSECPHGR